jgi:hypothetical protein
MSTDDSTDDSEEQDPVSPREILTIDSPVASSSSVDVDPPVYGSERDRRAPTDTEQNTADDVDVRGLFHSPTTDLLRWLYRHNAEAGIVVDKPVKDAFKHGYEFIDTSNAEQKNAQQAEDWVLMEYEEILKQAYMKARRDGFSLIMWVVNDEAEKAAQSVQNPSGISTLNILTLDDLVNSYGQEGRSTRDIDALGTQKAAEHTDYDAIQLDVTQSGLVVVDDITSPDHGKFVGCYYSRADEVLSEDAYDFIHHERLQRITARPQVDGDVNDENFGHLEGDSVLTPIFHALLGLTKAEWALGQSILRYTAPLHVVEIDEHVQPAEGSMEEHLEQLNDDLGSLTTKSNVALPPFHEMKTVGDDNTIDPEPYLDGLINQVTAGSEITRSVLQGTQTGTVSGSTTDIKNYYNQVERLRENELTAKIHEGVEMAARFDSEAVPNFATSFRINWGDLFQIDDIERAEAMRVITAATGTGISNYMLTPEEAREILQQQWATLDVDVDLSEDLDEADFDQLDRVTTSRGKQFPEGVSPEEELAEGQSPRSGQNMSGREEGSTESTPRSADSDGTGDT